MAVRPWCDLARRVSQSGHCRPKQRAACLLLAGDAPEPVLSALVKSYDAAFDRWVRRRAVSTSTAPLSSRTRREAELRATRTARLALRDSDRATRSVLTGSVDPQGQTHKFHTGGTPAPTEEEWAEALRDFAHATEGFKKIADQLIGAAWPLP